MAIFGSNDESIGVRITTSSDNSGIDETNKSLGRLDNQAGISGGALAAVGAAARTAVVAIGAAGVAAGAAATVVGFKFNSSVEQAQAQIMAFTKDAAVTAKTLAWVKDEAAKTQFSFTDMAAATAGLIPAAKSARMPVEALVRQAEVLAALNPAEGLQGAAFALREALSGDFVSVVERFNLPRQRLNELKAQGVPAIDAIRTALAEMGIDFSLVEAQGQTTAARWDQLKDKLTMLAGAASKPIFDLVSKGLDGLANGVDFDALNKRMTRFGEASVDAFKKVSGAVKLVTTGDFNKGISQLLGGVEEDAPIVSQLLNIRETFLKIGDVIKKVLGPSFKALGDSLKNDYLPAVKRLLPYVDDLAKILGGVLVAAIWIVINALTVWIKMYSATVNAIFAVKDAIGATVDFIAARLNDVQSVWSATWSAAGAIITAVWENVVRPVFDTISTAVRAVGAVHGYVFSVIRGAALVAWWSIYNEAVVPVRDVIVAAAHWIGNVVIGVWNWISGVAGTTWRAVSGFAVGAWQSIYGVWSGVVGYFSGVWNSIRGAGQTASGAIGGAFSGVAESVKGAFRGAINWIIDQINNLIRKLNGSVGKLPGVGKLGEIPKFEKGVRNFRGGLAVVGDVNGRGGELIDLPPGSNVYSNRESKEMLKGAGGGSFTHYGDVILNSGSAVREWYDIQGRNTELAQRGLTTLRGSI